MHLHNWSHFHEGLLDLHQIWEIIPLSDAHYVGPRIHYQLHTRTSQNQGDVEDVKRHWYVGFIQNYLGKLVIMPHLQVLLKKKKKSAS